MMIEVINGHISGYKTPEEIAKDWNVSPGTAREYIKRYHVNTLKVEDRNYIREGTPKPTKRSNKRKVETEAE